MTNSPLSFYTRIIYIYIKNVFYSHFNNNCEHHWKKQNKKKNPHTNQWRLCLILFPPLLYAYKKRFRQNHVSSVIWLAWQGDTGNGFCAQQTQRLTVATARETAPPPSRRMEKMHVCALCLGSNSFNLRHHKKRSVAPYNFILWPEITPKFGHDKGLLRNPCQHRSVHTHTHLENLPTHIITHNGFAGWSAFLRIPLLFWILFQVLTPRGCGLFWGRGGGGWREGGGIRGC